MAPLVRSFSPEFVSNIFAARAAFSCLLPPSSALLPGLCLEPSSPPRLRKKKEKLARLGLLKPSPIHIGPIPCWTCCVISLWWTAYWSLCTHYLCIYECAISNCMFVSVDNCFGYFFLRIHITEPSVFENDAFPYHRHRQQQQQRQTAEEERRRGKIYSKKKIFYYYY